MSPAAGERADAGPGDLIERRGVVASVTLPGAEWLGRLAGQALPGYSAGFGWVAPAVAGFVVGLLVHRLSGGRADDSPAGSAPTLA